MKYTITTMIIGGEETKLLNSHLEDGSVWGVPFDETNTDYQMYLAWLADGNTPEEH